MTTQSVAVIGAGPAGLMAAQEAAAAGQEVHLFDAQPSVGRKFLLAGKGGLNLTHAEPLAPFVSRYGERAQVMAPWLQEFGPDQVRAWAAELGVPTFVGSSQRVFPQDMKAAPLLRAWLHRLRGQGVHFHMRHHWLGWAADGSLRFDAPTGPVQVQATATVLALGGASWKRLGSDGAWWPWLRSLGADLAPLRPSNCGFDVGWSKHLQERHAGAPLKGVAIRFKDWYQAGEMVLTATGVEGSLVYAVSAPLRERIASRGKATFHLDLLPERSLDWVQAEVSHPRGTRSLSTHLKSRLGLSGAKAALLWELVPKEEQSDPVHLAGFIKALPITVTATRPIDEAISTAGGLRFEGMDEHLMLRALPGVFGAGEMLDWEAPTGGYLLTACFSTGRVAGQGAAAWVRAQAAAREAANEAAAADTAADTAQGDAAAQ